MKSLEDQKRDCGVSFEPIVDLGEPYIAVDYARPFQLLTLAEARALNDNLRAAYRRAALAAGGEPRPRVMA